MAVLRDLYPPINSLIRRKKIIDALKVVKSEGIKPWGRATQAKLGSRLVELLIKTAYVQLPLTQSGYFIPEFRPDVSTTKEMEGYDKGGYLFLRSYLKAYTRIQETARCT
ncbi:hypothetical protein Rs2_06222 [Raphanus sativus]|nr:hypothetical protein Rs2_06222 [Raphanus sativus]